MIFSLHNDNFYSVFKNTGLADLSHEFGPVTVKSIGVYTSRAFKPKLGTLAGCNNVRHSNKLSKSEPQSD